MSQAAATDAVANHGLSRLLTWLPSRAQTSLNGSWRSIIDVYDVGVGGPFGDGKKDSRHFGFAANRGRHSPGRRAEYDFDDSPTIEVPGDWNTQHERFHFYEGSMWFRRQFDVAAHAEKRCAMLYIGAANYHTLVYVNGERVGEHVGGYGPFCIDVSKQLVAGEQNTLILRVNNRRAEDGVPTTRTDWFNYGGVTRDVILFDLPASYIRDAVVQLDNNQPNHLEAQVWIGGEQRVQEIEVEVAGAVVGNLTTNADGYGQASLPVPEGLTRWSPDDPVRHEVTLRCATDTVHDMIGFRTIETVGANIVVNGEPVFLAGISLHDEALGENACRITTADQAREVLSHAKDLGANFVRLAHYQHNELTVRMCDELGLLAWCEVPVYWAIDWTNPGTYANAESQLGELIERDRNRAAVILWSVANETPVSDERNDFLRRLIAHARALDPSRLVTAALFARPENGTAMEAFRSNDVSTWLIDDPLGEDLDVLGVNEYHGWYYGTFENMAELTWETPYDKPLIVTEFGADARHGLRGDIDESWTEDLQAEIYRHQFAMLARIPFLAGTTPWNLKDFRAPFRMLPGVQDGFNRKGLIDLSGNKKLAFEVVADWNYGQRGVDRP